MICRHICAVAGLAVLAGSIAFAQQTKDSKPATQPSTTQTTKAQPGHDKPQLPPGMTEADMQACMEAGTPGPNHAYLTELVGTWTGKSTMWMTPEAQPVNSECTMTVTSLLDGKFIKCEHNGEIPGMGPFHGYGLSGFDNVSQTFQSTWIDSCGTGMMVGKGQLSTDKSTLTWNFDYNCPITKKPAIFREVERRTGKDSMTMQMFGTDPKSGKEFKMMEIAFTRKAGGATTPATAPKTPAR